MNHTYRIILCVFLFVILYVILKYINSIPKKPLIKDNKKDLGNTEFYYDDGGNDYYPEPTVYVDANATNAIDVTESFIQ